MVTEQHVREFMSAAINGVSKAQVIRTFRDDYNLNDDDIGVLLKACNFKRAPRNIDYKEFAEIDITKNAERIYYPFTRIYKIKNFLNEYECDRLIENIDQFVHQPCLTPRMNASFQITEQARPLIFATCMTTSIFTLTRKLQA
jgi:hypothetical protein